MDLEISIRMLFIIWFLCKFLKVLRPSHDYGEPINVEIES